MTVKSKIHDAFVSAAVYTGIVAVIGGVVALGLGGLPLSNKSAAARALDDAGYTEVKVTGWNPRARWNCGIGEHREYSFATAFSAKSPKGEMVKGAVCSGVLKGAVIHSY